jgi:hypothetical protein
LARASIHGVGPEFLNPSDCGRVGAPVLGGRDEEARHRQPRLVRFGSGLTCKPSSVRLRFLCSNGAYRP